MPAAAGTKRQVDRSMCGTTIRSMTSPTLSLAGPTSIRSTATAAYRRGRSPAGAASAGDAGDGADQVDDLGRPSATSRQWGGQPGARPSGLVRVDAQFPADDGRRPKEDLRLRSGGEVVRE